jgi:hypothetical protein
LPLLISSSVWPSGLALATAGDGGQGRCADGAQQPTSGDAPASLIPHARDHK